MEQTIVTSRLKLTLVNTAEEGSPELTWLHELRSDEKATWWSIAGRSKSLSDTQAHLEKILPDPNDGTKYRIPYAIHEVLPDGQEPRFIGCVTLRSLGSTSDLVIPPSYFPASLSSPSTLVLEIGYSFLTSSWGRGFATEAVSAVLAACRGARLEFWGKWEKVYLRAVVNAENDASAGVMRKSGMTGLGIWVWEGKPVWLAGEWRGRGELGVWGGWIVE